MICRSDIDEDISDISNEMPAWVELNDFEIGTRFCFDSPYTLYNKPWRKHTGQLCGMTSLDVVIYLILELYFLLHDSSRRSLIIIFLKLIIGTKFEDTIDKS
jgi:hypothetical protein